MKIALIASTAVLAGCVALMPPQERAARASDSWLCHAALTTSSYEREQIYMAELKRRGSVCTPEMAAAQQARRDAETAAGLALIRNGSRPAPAPASTHTYMLDGRVVTCITSGGMTTCH